MSKKHIRRCRRRRRAAAPAARRSSRAGDDPAPGVQLRRLDAGASPAQMRVNGEASTSPSTLTSLPHTIAHITTNTSGPPPSRGRSAPLLVSSFASPINGNRKGRGRRWDLRKSARRRAHLRQGEFVGLRLAVVGELGRRLVGRHVGAAAPPPAAPAAPVLKLAIRIIYICFHWDRLAAALRAEKIVPLGFFG